MSKPVPPDVSEDTFNGVFSQIELSRYLRVLII
jgi:hypothetical protein